MSQVYSVFICESCERQQWYSGTCIDCNGRVKCYPALLIQDIKGFAAKSIVTSSPSAAVRVERFVSSLLEWSRQRSG